MDKITKVRKKPCPYCIFSKNAYAPKKIAEKERETILSYKKTRFGCHHYGDDDVMCTAHATYRPDLAIGLEQIAPGDPAKLHGPLPDKIRRKMKHPTIPKEEWIG